MADSIPTSDGSIDGGGLGFRACLVEIHGDEVERRIDLERDCYTIGRVETDDIVISTPSVSRTHATIEVTDSGHEIVDADSTNGTFVNDVRIQRCPLNHEDVVVVGSTALRYLCSTELDLAVSDVLSRIPRTDGLTQVANRAALEEEMVARAQAGAVQCLIALEIESFAPLEGLLKQRIRRTDLLARIGRHQFAMLLDNADESSARRKADSLRRHVALSTFRYHEAQIPIAVRAVVQRVEPEAGPAAALLDHMVVVLGEAGRPT